MAHARSPASTMRRNVRCRSIASGVVRSTGSAAPPTICSMVPSRPHCTPAASRIARVTYAVVVLPFVPGHARDAQRTRRLAEEAVGERRHGGARIGDDRLRHGDVERPLAHHGDRAGGDRGGGVVVPVTERAGHADEQRSGDDATRVVGEVGHLDAVRPVQDRAHVEGAEQVVEQHARSVGRRVRRRLSAGATFETGKVA